MKSSGHEYPGLEIVLRQAMERAETGLPPDVSLTIIFAIQKPDPEPSGLAYISGVEREGMIETIVEWLARQIDQGHGDVVRDAFEKWILNRKSETPEA